MNTRKTIQQYLTAIVGSCAILLSADTSLAAPAVIAGPIYNPATAHWYYLLSSDTWTNSQAAATALGGHLVTINDAAEDQWVFDTFSQFGNVDRHLWIGLNDLQQPGVWKWSSGENATYRNWSPGQPDFVGSDRWVQIFSRAASSFYAGDWNNYRNVATVTEPGFAGPVHGVVEFAPECCACEPPDANNDAINLGFERPRFPLQLNVLGNDTDPKSLPLSIVNVFPPELATISPNGLSLQFTPPANFAGTASVWYEVSNGSCSSWAVATVRFENSPPTAVDDTRWNPSYSASTVFTVNAAANDLDANDQPNLKITGFFPPLTGKVVIDAANNVLKFTCNNGFSGKEQFVYTVSDGFGGTSSAYVFIRAGRKIQWVGDVFNPTSGARALVDVNVGAGGDATGTVVWDGQTYRFKTAMGEGWQTITIPPKKRGLPPITIDLDLVDGVVIATVGDGINQATGPIEVANTNQTPGYYTFYIDSPGAVAPDTRGFGYGGLTVNANGTFIVKGGLPDGKPFAGSGTVNSLGKALFTSGNLAYPTGSATGWASGVFTVPQSGTHLSGAVEWFKPQQITGGTPLAPFIATMNAEGEFYTPPPAGQLPLFFLGNAVPGPSEFQFEVAPGFAPLTMQAQMKAPAGNYTTSVFIQTSGASQMKIALKYNKVTGFFSGGGSSNPKALFGSNLRIAGVLIQGAANEGFGTAYNTPFVGSGEFHIIPQ